MDVTKGKIVLLVNIAVLLTLLAAVAGCRQAPAAHPVAIVGDVAVTLEYADMDSLQTVSVNGRSYRAVPLAKVLAEAEPFGLTRVAFIGLDNHMATIEIEDENEDLAGSYLAWSDEHGWHFVSERYPVNTAIKRIRQVIVQGEDAPGLGMVRYGRNYPVITPGQILTASHRLHLHEEGRTARQVDGVKYEGSAVSRHAVRQVRELVPGAAETVTAVGLDGSMHRLGPDSFLEARGNRIYLNRFDHTPPIALAGLILDHPERMVTDLFEDVLDLVDSGEKVLVIMVDGFSYPLFDAAVEEGLTPHMLEGARVEKALTVFPPITPCGMAAMLTGQLPHINGIGSRNDRVLQAPSLLEVLEERGKKGVYITGSISSIQLEGEVVLNTDRNNDGETDDDIFAAAMEHLDRGYDFIMVHFKSVDTAGHSHGPLAEETKERLAVLDGYAGDLFAAWNGRRIVLTDHGMHETANGGHHGLFKYEDLYIPYLTYD